MENNDRRKEILIAASQLIEEKGLSNTSTNDIVKYLGIARGTLYHYFNSKDEIIDALSHEMTENLLDNARKISKDKNIPVGERFWKTINSLNANTCLGGELLNHIHLEENLKLNYKIESVMLREIPKILFEIINEGIDEGIFSSKNPLVSLEMMVSYVISVIDSDSLNLSETEREKRLIILVENMEILLGCERGFLINYLK